MVMYDSHIFQHTNMVNLHALYKFKLPSLVPTNGSISYQNLAQSCGIEEDALRRIARYAVTKHIFQEANSEHLAHSATSKMLAKSPMMMEWMGMTCEEMWPAAMQVRITPPPYSRPEPDGLPGDRRASEWP